MTNHAITDKNYEHVVNVWKAFKMNNMKNYHDLYFKVDALLLAFCVFETFRKVYIIYFQLHPAQYLSTSVYS